MNAHTPGPWAVGTYDATTAFRLIDHHVAVLQDTGSSDGLLLAVTGDVAAGSYAQSVADARLIAAAPALLEAAQALVGNPRPSAFARNRLRAAIAAATGEEEVEDDTEQNFSDADMMIPQEEN